MTALQTVVLIAAIAAAVGLALFTVALCKAAALGDQHPSPHPTAPSPDPRRRPVPEDRAA